ncbi:hypothetical protein NY78_1927 [Desulfovibrio sp. TomC]|nr:hypothetical protein NY78_1927 [Desulfovibrio sp. TomC]
MSWQRATPGGKGKQVTNSKLLFIEINLTCMSLVVWPWRRVTPGMLHKINKFSAL